MQRAFQWNLEELQLGEIEYFFVFEMIWGFEVCELHCEWRNGMLGAELTDDEAGVPYKINLIFIQLVLIDVSCLVDWVDAFLHDL